MGFFDKAKKAVGGGGFDLFKPTERLFRSNRGALKSGKLQKTQGKTAAFSLLAGGDPLTSTAGQAYFAKKDAPGVFDSVRGVGAAGAVSGLGAFSHLLDKPGRTDAPSAVSSPGTGSETSTRTQEAREQAILEARQRRGMSSTVTTTPLGVTSFAGTSKKKLIGE